MGFCTLQNPIFICAETNTDNYFVIKSSETDSLSSSVDESNDSKSKESVVSDDSETDSTKTETKTVTVPTINQKNTTIDEARSEDATVVSDSEVFDASKRVSKAHSSFLTMLSLVLFSGALVLAFYIFKMRRR